MKDLYMRVFIASVFIFLFAAALYFVLRVPHQNSFQGLSKIENQTSKESDPLSITAMRAKAYPGSNLVIESEVESSPNYKKYIASYTSEGNKIYGLLTVPNEEKPAGGFPIIIFNHGYIPPEEYRTNERYVAYLDGFARNGFVVFKPDYRGHGDSEGEPTGAYFSPAYTVDVLNALSSVQKLPYVDKSKVGMWGHSLGGNITQRALVINPNIKAAVIWGGVVGSYEDLFSEWWSKRRVPSFTPSSREANANRPSRQRFIDMYGEPTESSEFWNSISPTTYFQDVKTPVQLHHGLLDETVPFSLSQKMYDKLKILNKPVEVYFYEGNDHNLSQSFNLAQQRSIDFFTKHLK